VKSFIKGVWSRTKKEPGARRLEHPRDLLAGDIIQITDSYALPPMLQNQSLRVVSVSTYQFEYEFSTSFSLEGQGDEKMDLIVEEEDGRENLAFTLKVSRDTVEELFDMDQFSDLFEGEDPALLDRQSDPEDLNGWTAPLYRQGSQAERGFYYTRDYRSTRPPDEEGEGEPFDYFSATSDDGGHAIEIEVWTGGETDVFVTIYRPISDIKELWPGSAGTEDDS
jgi:hypothetical protein